MDLYHIIGQQIKKARKKQDVGQKVLASMLGYTCATISQYESGKRCILLTHLEKIAATLNQPLTYFLSPSEDNDEKKRKGLYVPLKQYKMLTKMKKIIKKSKETEQQSEKQKKQIKKLESQIQRLMSQIAEQAQIVNQTATLYNELKMNEKKIREGEKLAATHKIIKDIAYHFNNPITITLGFIQLLISETKPENQTYKDLKRLERIVKRCIKTINELLGSIEGSNPHPPLAPLAVPLLPKGEGIKIG